MTRAVDEFDAAARVADRRLDLAAVTDDAGVGEESIDVAFAEASHALEVEAGERLAEALALAQDCQPREPRLEALQAELLEQPLVVGDREAPLRVVIGAVDLGRVGPRAAGDTVVAADQTDRHMALHEGVKDLIQSGALGHLVTTNPDGTPHVTCVWVAVDGDDLLTAHLNPQQKKLQNVRMN